MLNGTAERILHTVASANAQRDATLQYAFAAWQATRRESESAG